jgi:hypothetical protein
MFDILNFSFNLFLRVIRAEAETCFENENRYSHVTFAFDDLRFRAHNSPSNPKHNETYWKWFNQRNRRIENTKALAITRSVFDPFSITAF